MSLKRLTFLFAISILLLGACNNTASSEKCSDCPESVQNGTVSVKYYEQVLNFYRDSRPMVEPILGITDTQVESTVYSYSEEEILKINEILSSLDARLESYKERPRTEADKEIEFQFEKVVHFQLELNELERRLLNDEDVMYDVLTTSSLMKNIIGDLDDVVFKYGLVEE